MLTDRIERIFVKKKKYLHDVPLITKKMTSIICETSADQNVLNQNSIPLAYTTSTSF